MGPREKKKKKKKGDCGIYIYRVRVCSRFPCLAEVHLSKAWKPLLHKIKDKIQSSDSDTLKENRDKCNVHKT
jgi:hypothetical protein